MPTSPRESEMGLPTLRVSIRASSSPFSSTSVASRRNRRARSEGITARQAGNAAFARATAASASSTPACSSSAIASSVAGLTTCTVLLGLPHELLKEPRIVAGFGMPEHTHREAARRIFDRLQSAVVGPGHLGQALTEPAEALVMVRLDRHTLAEKRADATAALQPDVVVGKRAGRVLVLLVADHVGQVLNEVAAERHVEHLAAAADSENGHVARERRLEQRQLGPVALLHDAGGLRFEAPCPTTRKPHVRLSSPQASVVGAQLPAA